MSKTGGWQEQVRGELGGYRWSSAKRQWQLSQDKGRFKIHLRGAWTEAYQKTRVKDNTSIPATDTWEGGGWETEKTR